MKASAVAIVMTTGAVGIGCAGVLGITDVHAVDEPDGAAAIMDADVARDALATSEGGTTEPVDGGKEGGVLIPGRRVFVTSSAMNGAIGSAKNADAICATAAQGLGGTWVAWFSTPDSNAPEGRFTYRGPWSLLDGTLVANDLGQLKSGTLAHAISLNEKKQAPAAGMLVWTGTKANGSTSTTNCTSWTDSTATVFGEAGSPERADAAWTESNTLGGPFFVACNSAALLYCFEQ